MGIETTHNDVKIEFHEHSEEWYCEDWRYSNTSLQKVKDHIERK